MKINLKVQGVNQLERQQIKELNDNFTLFISRCFFQDGNGIVVTILVQVKIF